jgi:hypothetical protein
VRLIVPAQAGVLVVFKRQAWARKGGRAEGEIYQQSIVAAERNSGVVWRAASHPALQTTSLTTVQMHADGGMHPLGLAGRSA